jgi:hypothetical protein
MSFQLILTEGSSSTMAWQHTSQRYSAEAVQSLSSSWVASDTPFNCNLVVVKITTIRVDKCIWSTHLDQIAAILTIITLDRSQTPW